MQRKSRAGSLVCWNLWTYSKALILLLEDSKGGTLNLNLNKKHQPGNYSNLLLMMRFPETNHFGIQVMNWMNKWMNKSINEWQRAFLFKDHILHETILLYCLYSYPDMGFYLIANNLLPPYPKQETPHLWQMTLQSKTEKTHNQKIKVSAAIAFHIITVLYIRLTKKNLNGREHSINSQ